MFKRGKPLEFISILQADKRGLSFYWLLVLYFLDFFICLYSGSIHQGHDRFSDEFPLKTRDCYVFGCFSMSTIFADSRMVWRYGRMDNGPIIRIDETLLALRCI